MSNVTLCFSSLNADELRAVLVAARREFALGAQPVNIATSYAAEHNGGNVGCIVRVAGAAFEVTTMPLTPASASIVTNALSRVECSPKPMTRTRYNRMVESENDPEFERLLNK